MAYKNKSTTGRNLHKAHEFFKLGLKNFSKTKYLRNKNSLKLLDSGLAKGVLLNPDLMAEIAHFLRNLKPSVQSKYTHYFVKRHFINIAKQYPPPQEIILKKIIMTSGIKNLNAKTIMQAFGSKEAAIAVLNKFIKEVGTIERYSWLAKYRGHVIFAAVYGKPLNLTPHLFGNEITPLNNKLQFIVNKIKEAKE